MLKRGHPRKLSVKPGCLGAMHLLKDIIFGKEIYKLCPDPKLENIYKSWEGEDNRKTN